MKRVVVTIDRLVLKGFRYEDRYAIAQGLQEQLAQLLSEPGMAERIGAVGNHPHLRGAPIHLAPEMKPRDVGTAAANSIETGLNR